VKKSLIFLAIAAYAFVSTAQEVSIPLVGVDGESRHLLCIVGEEVVPDGKRIFIPDKLSAVRATVALHVGHGWWAWIECFDGMDVQEICTYARDYLRFDLWIDDAWVRPHSLNIYQVEFPNKPYVGTVAWVVAWIYEFPAQSLVPGIFTFRGEWQRNARAQCYAPDETFPDSVSAECVVLIGY